MTHLTARNASPLPDGLNCGHVQNGYIKPTVRCSPSSKRGKNALPRKESGTASQARDAGSTPAGERSSIAAGVVWQCPCGAYNSLGRYVCHSCAKTFSIDQSPLSSTVEQAPYKRTAVCSTHTGATTSPCPARFLNEPSQEDSGAVAWRPVSTSSGVEHRHAKTTIESERLNWSVPGQYPGLKDLCSLAGKSEHAPHSMAAGNSGCCQIRGLVVNSSRAGVVTGLDVDPLCVYCRRSYGCYCGLSESP